MSSIKDLKKEINYIFGEVIDEANYKQLVNPDIETKNVEAIIDEAVAAYEDFYKKINAGRQVDNKKQYFNNLNKDIVQAVNDLINKINDL